MTSWRVPGVIGLNFFSAILCPSGPQRPVATSIDWPSASVTIAFFTSLCAPDGAAEPLHLALADERVDAGDLDAEQRLDRGLDLGLRRLAGDVEDDLVVLGSHGRLLGDRRD